MKIKIFKGVSKAGKEYYYIPATNFKDKNDKLNYYVSFAKDCGVPQFQTGLSKNGSNYYYADVDVLQMYFGCFNGKPQITIAKMANASAKVDNTFYKEDIPTDIGTDDLPF